MEKSLYVCNGNKADKVLGYTISFIKGDRDVALF